MTTIIRTKGAGKKIKTILFVRHHLLKGKEVHVSLPGNKAVRNSKVAGRSMNQNKKEKKLTAAESRSKRNKTYNNQILIAMKKTMMILIAAITGMVTVARANDTTTSESPFFVKSDFVSRYIWRGLDYGNAPAIQPSVGISYKGFTLGGWGSYAIGGLDGYLETDLYTSYAFDFGLSIGVTDYFFPSAPLSFDTSSGAFGLSRSFKYFSDKTHYLEGNLGFAKGCFSFTANYMFYNLNDDIYAELSYTPKDKNITFFVGAGNEGYAGGYAGGEFAVVNAGIAITKEIEISDKFSLPMFGKIHVNPDADQIHLIVGISL